MASPLLTIPGVVAYWQNGVGVWQDTAGTVPATANGAPVGRWDDQVGGFHVTQTVDATRPSVVAASPYKARPGVTFTAASSTDLRNGAFNATSNVTEGTWVLAYYRPGTSGSPVIEPPSNVLMVYDQSGSPRFFFTTPRSAAYVDGCFHGKALLAIYDGDQAVAADRFRLRVNRTDRTPTYTGIAPDAVTATVAATGLRLGPSFNGTILEAAYVDHALTADEIDAIEDYWAEHFFDQGQSKVHVLGDSIPAGYPNHTVDGQNWPTQLDGLLPSDWSVQNVALTGYEIRNLEGVAATIDRDRDEWRTRDLVILEAGVNDIFFERTTEQMITDQTASVANRHLKGYEVAVQTLIPVGISVEEWEDRRIAYNEAVRNGGLAADSFFDLVAIGGFASSSVGNAYYEADDLHLNAVGAAAAAAAAYEFIMGAPPLPSVVTGRRWGFGIRRGSRP